MKKVDWVRKLTSRKLWLAIAGLVTGLIIAFKGDANVAETVSGSIMAFGSVVAYIVGEGLTDYAAINSGVDYDEDEDADEDEED